MMIQFCYIEGMLDALNQFFLYMNIAQVWLDNWMTCFTTMLSYAHGIHLIVVGRTTAGSVTVLSITALHIGKVWD